MKKAFAGPWVGELGWELCAWQAYLRNIREQYDPFIVSSRLEREYLYRDFYSAFVPYDPGTRETSDINARDHVYTNIHTKYIGSDDAWVKSRLIMNPHERTAETPKQTFIKYGVSQFNERFTYDIVISTRGTNKYSTSNRNWPLTTWNALSDHFKDLKIASIGRLEESHVVEGTEDLRGISLEGLAKVLYQSRVCVGTSSGPMHFASLCGCPHVVLTIPSNIKRYSEIWNPFNTPVSFALDDNWQPDLNEVIKLLDYRLGKDREGLSSENRVVL